MVKTIFQDLTVVAKSTLDRATPPKWPIIAELYNVHDMYAVTITYKASHEIIVSKIKQPSFKHEGKVGTRKIWDQRIRLASQDRFKQILIAGWELEEQFAGMEYILYPEFTKKGMIHWHGLMYHSSVPACGLVEDSIVKVCRRFGKQYDVQKVNDLEAWYKYMTKEGRAPISTESFQKLPSDRPIL